MIRCLAIDDEPLALKQLVAYIQKVPFLELAAQCQSALEARTFLESDTVEAILCDINMPDLNGMDFVKSLASPPRVSKKASKACGTLPWHVSSKA